MTATYGILGWPVEHSRSPAMQSAAFRARRLEANYACFPVHPDDIADAVRGLKALGVRGANVTVPHQEAVIRWLDAVTPDQACAHPNGVMGPKITVDSATMMNKGLEVIEARWLFDLPAERIEVLIHPQSIVHSLVEYVDGSVIAQLSNPDMRVPIAYALAYPERIASGARPLELATMKTLTFDKPDHQRFPCLQLAYAAMRAGGTAPCVLNAANEVAVEAFLARRIPFTAIAAVIEDTLNGIAATPAGSLAEVLDADSVARRKAGERILLRHAA